MSELLTSTGPAVANHLWQSTVFAVAAGLLALLLKNNQARTRYWIWLAASLKFLVPFSLLIAAGSLLPTPQHTPVVIPAAYAAMDTVTEPFAAQASPATAVYIPKPEHHRVPTLLASLWLCGMLATMAMWGMRWRRVALVAREAIPATESIAAREASGYNHASQANAGRELAMLRRLERDAGMRPVRLLLSQSSMEPGVFGVIRPSLIWPQAISARLTDAQMEAIFAHELCHIRRRDNLFAMAHMLVQAAFWFHPLVWWMGKRMVEERERACDEEVLGRGSNAETYAESVLKICEFCLESPLACVSGITGADLKKRIVQIMTERVVYKLDLSRKLLLLTIGLAAVAMPFALGQVKAEQAVSASQRMAFEAFSAMRRHSADPITSDAPPHEARTAATPATPAMSSPTAAVSQSSDATEVALEAPPIKPEAPDSEAVADAQTATAVAQTTPKPPAFEVASIRRAVPDNSPFAAGFRAAAGTGPVSITSDRASFKDTTLKSLLMRAYGVRQNQLSGPAWIDTERYDVVATIPQGTPTSDVPMMLQHLLAERFHMTLHSETRTVQGYVLGVAKGGPKLQASTRQPGPNDTAMPFSIVPTFRHDSAPSATPLPTKIVGSTMPAFANVLSNILQCPVSDATGLPGRFDIILSHDQAGAGGADADSTATSASLFTAIHDLGLTLDSAKVPLQYITVEKADKMPTEN